MLSNYQGKGIAIVEEYVDGPSLLEVEGSHIKF